MRITNRNRKRYIKKVLILVLKSYCYKWLGEGPFKRSFDLENAVNYWHRYKMNQIKQYIYEQAFTHENAWFVYEEIKDFEDIRDLLFYLAPCDFYSPESTLLYILRNSKKISVVNKEKSNRYYLREVVETDFPSTKEELIRDLKTYIRSYVELIFTIKKRPFNLDQLYDFFINEEIKYNSAKKYKVFLYLKEKKKKSIEEILKLVDGEDNLQFANNIFKDLIKYDYKRFKHMAGDYYGSKKWGKDVKFLAYLKLFDIYKNDKEKAYYLGREVLQLMDDSNFEEDKKTRFRRLIKRYMRGVG